MASPLGGEQPAGAHDDALMKIGIGIAETVSASSGPTEAAERLSRDLQAAETTLRYLEGRFGVNHPDIMAAREELKARRLLVPAVMATSLGGIAIEGYETLELAEQRPSSETALQLS